MKQLLAVFLPALLLTGCGSTPESLTEDLIEKTDVGSRLVRQGDVEVNFVGRTRLTAQQVAFRTVMRRKFGAIFKEEISTDGFVLPGRWENSGTMKISQLVAEKGWLVLAWKLAKSGVRTATRP